MSICNNCSVCVNILITTEEVLICLNRSVKNMLTFSTFTSLWLRCSSPVPHELLQELQYVKNLRFVLYKMSLPPADVYHGDGNPFRKRHCRNNMVIIDQTSAYGEHSLLFIGVQGFYIYIFFPPSLSPVCCERKQL